MFFISFPILSYPIQSQATASTGYAKPYAKSNQINLLAGYMGVKHATHEKGESLRAPSLSKLDNTVNSFSIFNAKYVHYKMVGTPSFSQPYLCIQINATISTKNPSFYLSQFPPPYSTLTYSQNHHYNSH